MLDDLYSVDALEGKMDGWGGLRQVMWAALVNWLVITLQNVDVMQPCPSSLSTRSFLILQFRNHVTTRAGREGLLGGRGRDRGRTGEEFTFS